MLAAGSFWRSGLRYEADAVRVAGELYDEACFRERMGLAPTRKTISQIAARTVEEMRPDLAAGTGKKI